MSDFAEIDAEESIHDAFGELPLCGCGSPDVLVARMAAFIGLLQGPHKFDDLKAFFDDMDSEERAELMLHLLNHVNFLEHGSSVWGSWPTQRGLEFAREATEYLNRKHGE